MTQPTIRSWSFSRLDIFEKCPYRAKLSFLDRIPEPAKPLPAGKTESAADRGDRIHKAAESFVQGEGPLIKELLKFEAEFEKLKALYEAGSVSIEEEWGFDTDWAVTGWAEEDIWLRLKIDAFIMLDPQRAVVVDYKTGRKDGNEIKHAQQTQLYQLCAFLRYPELQEIHTELWYLDANELTRTRYTRAQGMRYLKRFHDAATKMTTSVNFPPRSNAFTCKWCPYNGTEWCPSSWKTRS